MALHDEAVVCGDTNAHSTDAPPGSESMKTEFLCNSRVDAPRGKDGESHHYVCVGGEDIDVDFSGNVPHAIDERQHMASTVALMTCMVAHSYLLVSVFPYSGFMAIDLIPGLNEDNAGVFAGLIGSSFMVGRTLSAFLWGKFADQYGRGPAMRASLVLSGIFSLLFGLSRSFSYAMTTRFLLGLSNSLLSTITTSVSELAGGDERLETRGMGLVMGCWGWAFLFSPAIGGALAEPARQFPDARWVRGLEPLVTRFPFLLPNLVAVALCLLAFSCHVVWVEETLPEEKRRELRHVPHDIVAWVCRLCGKLITVRWAPTRSEENLPLYQAEPCTRYDDNKNGPDKKENITTVGMRGSEPSSDELTCSQVELKVLKPNDSSGTQYTGKFSRDKGAVSVANSSVPESASLASLWCRKNTRQHLIVIWIFSLYMLSVDEGLPLFCISKAGGLGVSEISIGMILSGSGLIFAIFQYHVYTALTNRYGLYSSIKIGITVSVALTFFIPLSMPLNSSALPGKLSVPTLVFLSLTMAIVRIFCSAFYSSICISANRTIPLSHRGTMNGLSNLGGSVAKAIGPTFAGALAYFSFSSGVVSSSLGSSLMFGTLGCLGLVIVVSAFAFFEKSGENLEQGSKEDFSGKFQIKNQAKIEE